MADNPSLALTYKSYEPYSIWLCRPSGEIIADLTRVAFADNYEAQLGGADSFSFSTNEKVDGKPVQGFEFIAGKNLLRIKRGNEDKGFFEIQEVVINREYSVVTKEVRALSAESKLIGKRFFLTEGVFTLQEVLEEAVQGTASWTIDHIDLEIINRARLIDVADTNVLEFLLGTVQEKYECILQFNTVARTISAYQLEGFGRDTEIHLSYKNLVNSLKLEDMTNQVVTRLYLYGNADLSVREVNMGQDFIENFSFFKNLDWMSQGLIDALNDYDAEIALKKPEYDGLEAQIIPLVTQWNTKDAEAKSLGHSLATKNAARDNLVASGFVNTSEIQQLTTDINNIQASLNLVNAEKTSLSNQVSSLRTQVNAIIDYLSKSNHFTPQQLQELDDFTFEEMYQDEAFVLSTYHDYDAYIAAQAELLEFGKSRMLELCFPRIGVDVEVADFLQIEEFIHWRSDFRLGDFIWVNVGSETIKLRLAGYTHSVQDSSLTIRLSDRSSMNDSTFQMLEMLKSAMSAASTVSFERLKYKDYADNAKNSVLDLINNALDLSQKDILGNNAQMLIDNSGILMRREKTSGGFEPQQIRIGSNGIIFTKDGFNTINMAIGQVGTGENAKFGVVADVLVGKVILGTNLQIESGNQKTSIDENGLTVRSTNDLQQILIKADTGIKVQTRASAGLGWTDKFYVDVSGNLTFTGELIGSNMTNGSIVGSTINIGNGKFVVDAAGNLTSQTLNSSLTILSNEISTKVSSSEYNSTITQLSNSISLKVDQGQYSASVIVGMINNTLGVTIAADKINLNGAVIVNGTLTGGEIRGGVFKTQSGLGGGFVMANHGTNLVDYQFLGSPGPLVPIFEIRDDVSSTTINCHGTPRMGFNSSGSSTLSGYWTMGGLDIVTQRGTGSGLQIAATNLGIVIWEGGLMKGQFLYGGNTATFG